MTTNKETQARKAQEALDAQEAQAVKSTNEPHFANEQSGFPLSKPDPGPGGVQAYPPQPMPPPQLKEGKASFLADNPVPAPSLPPPAPPVSLATPVPRPITPLGMSRPGAVDHAVEDAAYHDDRRGEERQRAREKMDEAKKVADEAKASVDAEKERLAREDREQRAAERGGVTVAPGVVGPLAINEVKAHFRAFAQFLDSLGLDVQPVKNAMDDTLQAFIAPSRPRERGRD